MTRKLVAFALISSLFALILALVLVLPFIMFILAPVVYDWDLRLPSPDRAYNLVVLRGSASAIDDFTYKVYLFPSGRTPADRPKGTGIQMEPIWTERTYLVYSGYNYPMFRWTGPRSIEIDLDDLYIQSFDFEPVKRFSESGDPLLVSLAFGKEDGRNARP